MSEILDLNRIRLTKDQVRDIENEDAIEKQQEKLIQSWVRLMSYMLTGDPDKLQ